MSSESEVGCASMTDYFSGTRNIIWVPISSWMLRFRETITEPRAGSSGASARPSMRKTPRHVGVSSPREDMLSTVAGGLEFLPGVPAFGSDVEPAVRGPVTGPKTPPLPAAVAGVIDMVGILASWPGPFRWPVLP